MTDSGTKFLESVIDEGTRVFLRSPTLHTLQEVLWKQGYPSGDLWGWCKVMVFTLGYEIFGLEPHWGLGPESEGGLGNVRK